MKQKFIVAVILAGLMFAGVATYLAQNSAEDNTAPEVSANTPDTPRSSPPGR